MHSLLDDGGCTHAKLEDSIQTVPSNNALQLSPDPPSLDDRQGTVRALSENP